MGAGQGGSPTNRSGVDTAPDNVSSPDLRARWFTAETSKIGLEITAALRAPAAASVDHDRLRVLRDRGQADRRFRRTGHDFPPGA